MALLITILQVIVGLVSLACFILVVVKMFQNGQTALGVVCIVLLFCVGIGALIAFIIGWVNAQRWGITNIMVAWSVCVVIGVALSIVGFVVAPAPVVLPVR